MSLPEERMVLLYQKVDLRLYGHIAFYRKEQAGQEATNKPYRSSSPFVIGRYTENGDGRLEVLGSVVFLLEEIRRSIDGFVVDNNAWNEERNRLTGETEIAECDVRYDKKAMDFVILVSAHSRNLFDLMPRFNARSIPRLDYQGAPNGEVTLRELFDTLIHNRYCYFDGSCVRDLFSGEFKKKRSALSGRFMGYGFDMLDFVKGISEVIEEVTVKDLTQFLRGKFKGFTADSKPQDVVSLIQNVYALSELLRAKVPTPEYQFMLCLMFDDLAGVEAQNIIFQSPRIKIANELNRKEFEICVRCAVGALDQELGREDLKDHAVRIGFEGFFRKVNEAFGDDRVLVGKSRRFMPAPVEGSNEGAE